MELNEHLRVLDASFPPKAEQPYTFMVDKKRKKVVCLIAPKSLMDNIIGILKLPIATLVRLKHPDQQLGVIETIYRLVEKLPLPLLQLNVTGDMLLNPKPERGSLHHNVLGGSDRSIPSSPGSDNQLKFYYCKQCMTDLGRCFMTEYENTLCSSCKQIIEGDVIILPNPINQASDVIGAFPAYFITDDLQFHPLVSPLQPIRHLQKYDQNFCVGDVETVEIKLTEREVVMQILHSYFQPSKKEFLPIPSLAVVGKR